MGSKYLFVLLNDNPVEAKIKESKIRSRVRSDMVDQYWDVIPTVGER